MNDDHAEAIEANAKYLRGRRPIDPAEIPDYVAGNLDPESVRTHLRDRAFELSLVERPDGHFVAVPAGPIDPTETTPTDLSESVLEAIEAVLESHLGDDWASGEAVPRLRNTIDRLKAGYFAGRPEAYDQETALAYLCYHGPWTVTMAQHIFEELASESLLDHDVSVLDIGAGVGGPLLGLLEWLPQTARLSYHAIEPTPATGVLKSLLEHYRPEQPPTHRVTIERTSIESATLTDTYDIILCANVLNELEDPVSVLDGLYGSLAASGTLIAIEPADRETAIGLRDIERSLGEEWSIYAPTVRLWEGREPSDPCWSFTVKDAIATPPFQAALDDGSGTYIRTAVQYAHVFARKDGRRRYEVALDASQWAPLGTLEAHIGNRIDCVGIKLSARLSEDSANPLYRIGDGSETDSTFAVVANETHSNDALQGVPYGALLGFESVLVLWNDDEEGYNLVVDDQTRVEVFGLPGQSAGP